MHGVGVCPDNRDLGADSESVRFNRDLSVDPLFVTGHALHADMRVGIEPSKAVDEVSDFHTGTFFLEAHPHSLTASHMIVRSCQGVLHAFMASKNTASHRDRGNTVLRYR